MDWRPVAAGLVLGAAVWIAQAQEGYFTPPPPARQASQAELDRLLAPVALYPDALLGQVLAASTYPLEVVALHRWLERNPGLEGAALQEAIASQPWDEAVKALAPFRPVVAAMDAELEWTQRLGDAFLADEAGVMDAVQRLRRKAMQAGSLKDTPGTRVATASEIVYIEPADSALVPVPVYDPRVIYGPWWWPEYPPYAWIYPGYAGFGWSIALWPGWWDHHAHPDWHHHNLSHHRPGRPALPWTHNSVHRGGVPYADSRVRERHAGSDGRGRERRDFRGFEVAPGRPPQGAAPQARAPRSHPPQQSALSPLARDSARAHAERGRQSLGQAPRAPQSSQPLQRGTSPRASTSAPSPSPAPRQGGGAHGGSRPGGKP